MIINQGKKTGIVGIIGEGNSKKITLASILSAFEENVLTIGNIENERKPTYTFDSVFPNEEVAQEVMKEIDRANKRKVCEELGVVTTNIDDISWNQLIELNESKKSQKRPKFLEKIRGKGV